MSEPVNIFFGLFTVSFASPSSSVTQSLRRFFSGYESHQPPDFRVTISLSGELPDPVLQLKKEWVPFSLHNEKFEIGPKIINGFWDLKENMCSIIVHTDFFNLPLAMIFQSFLYRLYHTICLYRSTKSCFIHGCGVIREKRCYLFVGPHQSGKSTIGELSDGMIIHDDQIIITSEKEGLTVMSPPLPAKYRHRLENPCIIHEIYFIVQNDQISLKKLDSSTALKNLYSEIVLPLSLTSVDSKAAVAKKACICFEIIKSAVMYELQFDKRGHFWDLLTC